MKLAKLSVAILALAVFPLAARAQTVVFQDTFTGYGGSNSYNFGLNYGGPPNDPPNSYNFWNFNQVQGFNGFSLYYVPGQTSPFTTPTLSGQASNTNFIAETEVGWNNTGSPGAVSNITSLTTLNNSSLFTGSGDFLANTTYTLSVLVGANLNITPDITGLIAIDDGSNSDVLGSTTVTSLTNSFVQYSATYTTGASGGPIGDPIQITLEAIQDNGYTYNQEVDFNDPILTATPEPTTMTYTLLGLGLGLAILVIRNRKSRTSRL